MSEGGEYVQVSRVRPKSGGPWTYMEAHKLQGWMNYFSACSTPTEYWEVESLKMTQAEFEALMDRA